MSPNSQIAALPYIFQTDGLQICLISSRGTGRWVIPKGWLKPGLPPQTVAEQEALEEAGLIGNIHKSPFGSYTYNKRLHTFASIPCLVEIYPLEVTTQLLEWPEQHQREQQWSAPEQAAKLVNETELAEILLSMPQKFT